MKKDLTVCMGTSCVRNYAKDVLKKELQQKNNLSSKFEKEIQKYR